MVSVSLSSDILARLPGPLRHPVAQGRDPPRHVVNYELRARLLSPRRDTNNALVYSHERER